MTANLILKKTASLAETAIVLPPRDVQQSRAVDCCITVEIERRLRQYSYAALRYVEVAFREGTVKLSGRLPSFYLKQLAQTAARGVDGVEVIVNEIDVE